MGHDSTCAPVTHVNQTWVYQLCLTDACHWGMGLPACPSDTCLWGTHVNRARNTGQNIAPWSSRWVEKPVRSDRNASNRNACNWNTCSLECTQIYPNNLYLKTCHLIVRCPIRKSIQWLAEKKIWSVCHWREDAPSCPILSHPLPSPYREELRCGLRQLISVARSFMWGST